MNRHVVSMLAVTLLVCLTISSVADARCYRHCFLRCRSCGWWRRRRCCRIVCHYHCFGKRSANTVEQEVKNEGEIEVPCSTLPELFKSCLRTGENINTTCFHLIRVAECLGDVWPLDDDLEYAFHQADVKEECECLDKDEFPDLCYHGHDGKEDQCPPEQIGGTDIVQD